MLAVGEVIDGHSAAPGARWRHVRSAHAARKTLDSRGRPSMEGNINYEICERTNAPTSGFGHDTSNGEWQREARVGHSRTTASTPLTAA